MNRKVFIIIQILLTNSICAIAQYNIDFQNIVDKIDQEQSKIRNMDAEFTIIPLNMEKYDTPTLAGDILIDCTWIWDRSKVKSESSFYPANTQILLDLSYEKPFIKRIYAFDGSISLRYDEELVEKNTVGYLLTQRDIHDGLVTLTPNRLWFNTYGCPLFRIVEIFRNQVKELKIEKTEVRPVEIINNTQCLVLNVEYKQIHPEYPQLDYPLEFLTIWVDPVKNYTFLKITQGYIRTTLPQFYDYHITDQIEIKEIEPGIFLPIKARFKFYKTENNSIKEFYGHTIDIAYKRINFDPIESDFWPQMKDGKLIFDQTNNITAKSLSEYDEKVSKLKRSSESQSQIKYYMQK